MLNETTTIDKKYRLIRRLGTGGMGAVFEAQHATTGHRVAVKLMRGAFFDEDEESVRRFHREAKMAGAMDTEHIAQVLDAGTDASSGMPYLVLEYLEGEDLNRLLTRLQTLAVQPALRIVAQACVGLQRAHDARVVHRDIKPANLFLAQRADGDIVVKLLDFGIAKIRADGPLSPETAALTSTGALLGSPLYMSPEQARCLPGIDHRTDIWSLGIVLYRALSGRTPHGDIAGIGALIFELCSNPPPPIQDRAPWIPPDVAELVHRALHLEPEHRFQSAMEMREAILTLAGGSDAVRPGDLVPPRASVREIAAPRMVADSPTPRPYVAGDAPHTTTGTLGPSSSNAPASALRGLEPWRGKRIAAAVGTAMTLGLAGYGALRASTSAPVAPADPAPSVRAHDAPPPEAPAARAAGAEPRRVSLVVLPADAVVEVDGQVAAVTDGIVEIAGPLGSTHRVRLAKDGVEIQGQVVITESGAFPLKLVLPSAPAASSKAPAAARVEGKGAAPRMRPSGGAAKPSSEPANPLIPDQFE